MRKAREADLRKVLGLVEGDRLPPFKAIVEERLETQPSVKQARLEAACCDDEGKIILYVGIDEQQAARLDRPPNQTEHIQMPEEIVKAYGVFLQAVEQAARSGKAGEDLTQGHSLMADPDARAAQEQFTTLAAQHLGTIRKVLRSAESPEHRAMAAYVIGYAADKRAVVDDLLSALRDPDETVRGNASRSLAAFAVLANKNPAIGLKISPVPFIEMLHSVIWTDRNNAAIALVDLTEHRDLALLAELRQHALSALVEMAAWKHLPHALPAYILVGRAIGMPEKQLQDTWTAGNRDVVLKKAKYLRAAPK
jgi:hypothetical protein